MPLAAGLIEYANFEQAKALGFELFAGPFYASRHRAAVRKIPIGEMGTLPSLDARGVSRRAVLVALTGRPSTRWSATSRAGSTQRLCRRTVQALPARVATRSVGPSRRSRR
jgi:hypothetical protein